MVQNAVPDSDLNEGSWTEDDGDVVDQFLEIDEGVDTPDDADFIKSEDLSTAGDTTIYACGLTNITDPETSGSHVIKARVQKVGTAQMDLTVQLRQGYTGEGVLGTLIATLTQAAVTTSFVDYTYTLSGAEADAITDYTDLQLRIFGTFV